jgi:hypothetical protein
LVIGTPGSNHPHSPIFGSNEKRGSPRLAVLELKEDLKLAMSMTGFHHHLLLALDFRRRRRRRLPLECLCLPEWSS